MRGPGLLVCVLVFSSFLVHDATAKQMRHNNEAFKPEELNHDKQISNERRFLDNPGSDSSKQNEMSSSEREEKLKILTMEGKPGWINIVKQREQQAEQKIKEEIKAKNNRKSTRRISASAPTRLISDVKRKLNGFPGPLANRVKTTVTGLKTKWKGLSKDDKEGITETLSALSSNIEKFGNAGSDPIGAIQGAVNIVGAISASFGPTGQMVSIGLGFVSGILGLFGGGPKPRPIDRIVKEQIEAALAKYRDRDLSDKASGLVKAFQGSKAYLDGAAISGKPLSKEEMIIASTRVSLTQGSAFMGELATVIERMFKKNKEGRHALKCIKYCELYAQLAGLKDMIITQMISMASKEMQNDINGLMAYQKNYRDATKLLFEPLYTINYNSKILPYFDPDNSVVTDSYATSVLNLGKYDRSMAGLYCLMTPLPGRFVDLDWQREDKFIKKAFTNGKPYITTVKHRNANCYWKLVPHGRNIFSIVNKYKCYKNHDYCGAMLSWDRFGRGKSGAIITLDYNDPTLWEIYGGNFKWIRSKWGCSRKHKFCNQELRLAKMNLPALFGSKPKLIGILKKSNGRYYWMLKRKT